MVPVDRSQDSTPAEICAQYGIQPDAIPQHVAVICDGNGRWATRRGLVRTEGHAAGEEALWDTVRGALALGVRHLSAYVFSTENWTRPDDEVDFLMWFNRDILTSRREEANELGIRINVCGRRGFPIPDEVQATSDETEALTAHNTDMTLNFCFNYGSRAELVDATRAIAEKVAAGTLSPEAIGEATIAEHLYAPESPEPELLVRTSGEQRISNFLLWQLAYTELVFTDTMWPDFRRSNLYEAIAEYQDRKRRFGQASGPND